MQNTITVYKVYCDIFHTKFTGFTFRKLYIIICTFADKRTGHITLCNVNKIYWMCHSWTQILRMWVNESCLLHTYIHKYTYTCIHTHTYTHIHTYIDVSICIHTYIHKAVPTIYKHSTLYQTMNPYTWWNKCIKVNKQLNKVNKH